MSDLDSWVVNPNGEDNDFEISFATSTDLSDTGLSRAKNHALGLMASDAGSVCTLDETGKWTCRPYKREKLQDEMDNARKEGLAKRNVILETLQDMSVTCYIVQHDSNDIMQDLKSIVSKVARENRNQAAFNPNLTQRCCLYEDHEGRLFNLVVAPHAVGPAGTWASLLETFSGTQAMIAFTVLCRSLPCAFSNNIAQLRPAYLSLILGLVLSEEISLSWLNSSMLVRNLPSVSAHTLTAKTGSDWLRKLLTLTLALSAAATGEVQKYMTISGIVLACLVLLSNLGSRAWYFLKWKPFPLNGPLSAPLGYLAAVVAGMVVPYMGHREVEAGGKSALESVISSAFIVAVVFVLSDFDELQKLLVVGSETCPQDEVNIVIGCWWTLTVLVSMGMVLRIAPFSQFPQDEEAILERSHASPVGYVVPNLPEFVVDPVLVRKGSRFLSLNVEVVLGAVMALAVGAGIVFLAFTSVDDEFTGNINSVETLFTR